MTDDKWSLTNENRLSGLEKAKTAPEGAQGLSPGFKPCFGAILASAPLFRLTRNPNEPGDRQQRQVPNQRPDRAGAFHGTPETAAVNTESAGNGGDQRAGENREQNRGPDQCSALPAPDQKQIPTHSSKAGRKRANPAVTGHGVS